MGDREGPARTKESWKDDRLTAHILFAVMYGLLSATKRFRLYVRRKEQ